MYYYSQRVRVIIKSVKVIGYDVFLCGEWFQQQFFSVVSFILILSVLIGIRSILALWTIIRFYSSEREDGYLNICHWGEVYK